MAYSTITSRVPTNFIVEIALLSAGVCRATRFQTVIKLKKIFGESSFDIKVVLTIEEYDT
jgi:hypothetical protein